jgi:hypothetical protein
MCREQYRDVLEIWGLTWATQEQVWAGPEITYPEDPMLVLTVTCQRIIRQDGRDVLVDPGITLDRFGWGEEDAEAEEEP